MTATYRDMIRGSLRLIGAIGTGETPSAEEFSDGLYVMNSMLDSWGNDNLFVPTRVSEEFNLIPGTQTYTMGSGADFNTARPIEILSAAIKVGNYETPIDVINFAQWNEIQQKNVSAQIPSKLYVDYQSPLAFLNFWGIPEAANIAVLNSKKPLGNITNVSTALNLPPGYEKAIRYGLAIELCPEYGKSASPEVVSGFEEAFARIKRTNNKDEPVKLDPMFSNARFDINKGE